MVHWTLVVVVTVVVAVVCGMRFSQAQEIVSGLQVERAVGVGSEVLLSTDARRLLTERRWPLDIRNTDLTVSKSQSERSLRGWLGDLECLPRYQHSG